MTAKLSPKILLLTAFLFFSTLATAQTAPGALSQQELYNTIAALDSSMFAIIYSCKPEQALKFFTEDLEFYHDKGGLTVSRVTFLEVLKKNFCGPQEYRLRRELVKGSMQVFPMDNIGAVQTGEHFFYQKREGKDEELTGIAKFTQIWVYKNGEWRISRVISYDHQPANESHPKAQRKK